jgi:hypothetical protein
MVCSVYRVWFTFISGLLSPNCTGCVAMMDTSPGQSHQGENNSVAEAVVNVAKEAKPSAGDGMARAIDPQPKKKRQEPPAKKDSHLAQWIAVLAAIIAAVAAVTGALVSAHTSVSTTRLQSHASAVLAERQERRDGYSKFLSDVEDLDNREWQVADVIRRYGASVDPMFMQKLNDQYSAAYAEYGRQDDMIGLIDSPWVDAVAAKLVDQELNVHDVVVALVLSTADRKTASILVRLPDFDKYYGVIDATVTEFEKASIKDLQDLGYGEH